METGSNNDDLKLQLSVELIKPSANDDQVEINCSYIFSH